MNQGSGRYPDSACLSIWLNVKLRCLGDGCLGGRDAGRGSPGKGMACLSDSMFFFHISHTSVEQVFPSSFTEIS